MNPTPAAPVPHAPAPESLSSVEHLHPSSGPSPVTAPPLPAPAVVIQDVPHSHAGIPGDATVTHRKPSDAASNPTPTPGQAPAPSAPIKSTPTPAGEGKSASIPSSLVSDTPSAARASVPQSLPSPAVIDDFRTIKSQAPPVPDVGTRDGTPGSVDNAFIGGPPSRSMSSFANSITPDADGQSPPDQPKPHPIASYGVALPQPMRPSVATPNVDKRVVIQEPPIGVQAVDSLVPSSVKKGPPRPPNAADTATAKRAFDAATASRFDGLLPLHELPQLAEQLGVPMDEYYLEVCVPPSSCFISPHASMCVCLRLRRITAVWMRLTHPETVCCPDRSFWRGGVATRPPLDPKCLHPLGLPAGHPHCWPEHWLAHHRSTKNRQCEAARHRMVLEVSGSSCPLSCPSRRWHMQRCKPPRLCRSFLVSRCTYLWV